MEPSDNRGRAKKTTLALVLPAQRFPTRPHFLPGFQGTSIEKIHETFLKPPKNTNALACLIYKFVKVWGSCLGSLPPRGPAIDIHIFR